MLCGKTIIAVLFLLVGCLLLTAPGCALHRTDHGLVLSSQWSLELNRLHLDRDSDRSSVAKKHESTEQRTAKSLDRPKTSQDWASSRPELLPWRNKVREHRLAARLFNRQKPGKEKERQGEGAESIAAKKPQVREASPASPIPTQPASVAVNTAEFEADVQAVPSTEECELQMPDQVGSLPEISRPDLVVD